MLLGDVDWATVKDIVQMVVGGLTLLVTTLGAAWALYIGYRQKQSDNKLEEVKVNAAIAAKEAKRQGTRVNRRVKKLCSDTEQQTLTINETKQHVAKLEQNTNGMQERLLKEAAERAHREGHAKGTAEGTEKAKEVVKEVVKEVASQIQPVQVNVRENGEVQVIDKATNSEIDIPPPKAASSNTESPQPPQPPPEQSKGSE